MHLLEDMSVPLHTRNDVHIFPIDKMKDYKVFWNKETCIISKYMTFVEAIKIDEH